MTYNYSYKIITVGNANTGKTSLANKFMNDTFFDNSTSTIGVDYFTKIILFNNLIFKIQIWDTAGLDVFRCIIRSYYRQAVGVLLCYDINDLKSFNDLSEWLTELKKEYNNTVIFYIIGTKSDLGKRKVQKDLADNYASENNMKHFEISSVTGKNINEVFLSLVKDIYEKYPNITDINGIGTFPIDNIINVSSDRNFINKCC